LKPGHVARDVLPKILQNGVMLTAAGERVLRFSPPLVVTIAELEQGVAVLRKVLAQMDVKKAPAASAATP
jgi:acetylornithine/N-succinyldiaminopimelate aminotransferase